jgi:hypothetical protein
MFFILTRHWYKKVRDEPWTKTSTANHLKTATLTVFRSIVCVGSRIDMWTR